MYGLIAELRERVNELEDRVAKLEGKEPIMVELYVRQSGWTASPSPTHMIGPKGNFGETTATLALDSGKYAYLDSYVVSTADHGNVRWLKIRCDVGDVTVTDDRFAWLPVDPNIVNAESLYEALQGDDDEVVVDDYTQSVWDNM